MLELVELNILTMVSCFL